MSVNSITAIANTAQGVTSPNSSSGEDFLVTEEMKSESAEQLGERFNKYIYPEFANFEGERLLRKIVRKIVTRGLFLTWEVLTDPQVPGNDCFQSIATISNIMERGQRTIRHHFRELEDRKLMELRPGQKLLRQKDGIYRTRWVIIKDFRGLYKLAHEYWLWMQSPDFIEPEREFANVLRLDTDLMKKLQRFECYRRIIEDQFPGRRPRPREVHPLFRDFDPEDTTENLFAPPPQISAQEDAEDAKDQKTNAIRQFNRQIIEQNNGKLIAEERIIPSEPCNGLKGDSNDSESDSEEGAADDYTKNETPEPEQVRKTLSPFTPPTKTTNPEPNVSETGGAAQAESSQGQRRKKYQGDGKPRPVANAPISAYVHEFSQVLGDGNMHASETYLLRQAEKYGLSHPLHALACLVRAHVAAMPLEARYRDPITDKPLKMVTVNYLFKQFAQSFSEWSHAYLSNGELTEDIKKDERLKLFVLEYRAQDPGEPPEPHMVQPQDPEELAEPQLVFEELRIPSPAQWMNEAKAETLVARIEGDRDRLEAEKITLEFALIHRCRSLVYRGTVFIVELQLTSVNGAGQQSRWPMHLADELQWQHYCEEQKILPRSDQQP